VVLVRLRNDADVVLGVKHVEKVFVRLKHALELVLRDEAAVVFVEKVERFAQGRVIHVHRRPQQCRFELAEVDRSVPVRVHHVEEHPRAAQGHVIEACALGKDCVEFFVRYLSVVVLVAAFELAFDFGALTVVESDGEEHERQLLQDGTLAVYGHALEVIDAHELLLLDELQVARLHQEWMLEHLRAC